MKAIGLQNLVSLYKEWLKTAEPSSEAEETTDDNEVAD